MRLPPAHYSYKYVPIPTPLPQHTQHQIEVVFKDPTGPHRYKTPLLLVHGAFNDANCFTFNLLSYFSLKGFYCYALSFRGHGSSTLPSVQHLRGCAMKHYVADLKLIADYVSCNHDGIRPVVIGHGLGGKAAMFAATQACELSGMALLATPPPQRSVKPFLSVMRHNPKLTLKTLLTLRPRYLISTRKSLRDFMFTPQTKIEIIMNALGTMQDESMRAIFNAAMDSVKVPADGMPCPVFVLGGCSDAFIKPRMVEHTARLLGGSAMLLPVGHAMMADQNWGVVAEHLLMWLRDLGLEEETIPPPSTTVPPVVTAPETLAGPSAMTMEEEIAVSHLDVGVTFSDREATHITDTDSAMDGTDTAITPRLAVPHLILREDIPSDEGEEGDEVEWTASTRPPAIPPTPFGGRLPDQSHSAPSLAAVEVAEETWGRIRGAMLARMERVEG